MDIINTSKREVNPQWVMGGNPSAIEAQEKKGQEQLVQSAMLPTEVLDKEKFEVLGVVFGEPLEDDSLFCKCTIPEGWAKIATDHTMWSELLDAHGKTVGNIFYKAAFYDRKAHMSFNKAYIE